MRMPQDRHAKVLERAQALRQKVSSAYVRALELAEVANRARERSAQFVSTASAIQKKTLEGRAANASRVQFLKVDLDVALTFVKIALHSRGDHAKRMRNQANARKAHDAVVYWKNKLEIAPADALEIDAKLQELRAALEKLGEKL